MIKKILKQFRIVNETPKSAPLEIEERTSYDTSIACKNCTHLYGFEIPKGIPINRWFKTDKIKGYKCSNCGCNIFNNDEK